MQNRNESTPLLTKPLKHSVIIQVEDSQKSKPTMADLPNEVLMLIVGFLSLRDIASFAQVSKTMHQVAENSYMYYGEKINQLVARKRNTYGFIREKNNQRLIAESQLENYIHERAYRRAQPLYCEQPWNACTLLSMLAATTSLGAFLLMPDDLEKNSKYVAVFGGLLGSSLLTSGLSMFMARRDHNCYGVHIQGRINYLDEELQSLPKIENDPGEEAIVVRIEP